MRRADAMLDIAAALNGVSEALVYRAASEDDDMLALMADVIVDRAEALRTLARESKR